MAKRQKQPRRRRTETATRPLSATTAVEQTTWFRTTVFNSTPPLLDRATAAAYLGFATVEAFDLAVEAGEIEKPIRADRVFLTTDLDRYVSSLAADREKRRQRETADALRAEKAAVAEAPRSDVEGSLLAEAAK